MSDTEAGRRSSIVANLGRVLFPIAILCAGGGAWYYFVTNSPDTVAATAGKQTVRTKVLELRARDYPVVVKTHGVVQAHNEVTLNAQVSGKIIHVSQAFEAGSFFSKGDLLVELDAKDYQTALAMADARRKVADSALKLARLNEQRFLELVVLKAVSQAEVDRATATRAQAEAELESAIAQVDRAKLDLERTKIYAPFDGRVRQKDVGVGRSVVASAVLGVVFTVDFAEIRLPVAARERQFLDLPEYADDPPLEVELRDAISGTSETAWKGKIIRTEGVLDENSRELFAIARVDDPFGRKSGHPPLRIGQPVVASIAGKVLKDVIALPRGAVRQLDQINLVHKSELTLMPKTVVSLWSDEEQVIIRDPEIGDGTLLATTHLVYAPKGTKVEIIADVKAPSAVAKSGATGDSSKQATRQAAHGQAGS